MGLSEIQKFANFRLIRNRKALSEIVGYVLLIVIAISLSILVFAWLKGYIIKPEKTCPDGISISLDDYSCADKVINLTLKNTGYFNIDGYLVRVSNITKGKSVYFLKTGSGIENYFVTKDSVLKAEEEYSVLFSYQKYGSIKQLEIEPFKVMDKDVVLCKDQIISQTIENC